MSNTDNGAEKKPVEQEEWQTQPLIAKALYRQFSTMLVTLLLTFIVVLTLIFTLFYQQNERSRFLIEGELSLSSYKRYIKRHILLMNYCSLTVE